jgi:hypothetical protein
MKKIIYLITFFISVGSLPIFSEPIDIADDWLIKPSKDLSDRSENWTAIEKLPIGEEHPSLRFEPGLRYITAKKIINFTPEMIQSFESQPVSIHLPYIASYYEVYWNGKLQLKKGSIEDNHLKKAIIMRHEIIPILEKDIFVGENELRIVLAGYEGYNIDIWPKQNDESISIDLWKNHLSIISERVTLMLCFLYLFMGLYHFLFFYKRPQEEYNLYYGLFSALLAVYIYTRSNAVFELDMDGILLKRIEFTTVYIIPLFMIMFLDRFFLGKISIFSKIYGGLILINGFATVFGSAGFLNTNLKLWQYSVPYVMIHSLTVSVIAIRRKAPDIKRLLLGILILVVCGVWDTAGALQIMGLQNLGLMRFGFFSFVMGIAFILANRFLRIHKEVEELNEDLEKKVEARTEELQDSLKEIQALKVQQDGDYFLTSLLINPLTINRVGNTVEDYRIDFYTKQKKVFEFRGRKMEIGGDINIVDKLNLKGREFIVFVNGDAMGKSIQGAGGALVLGVIFHSVVNRTNQKKESLSKGPETWLKECYLELQSVFETFDGSMLMSVVMGLIDVKSGFLFFVNSEHPWTVLYRDGKAGFLEDNLELRKIGTIGLHSEFRIKTHQLEVGDIVYAGSDGRDDILLGMTENGERIINEDEHLFLKCIEESNGELDRTVDSIFAKGELTDDLSLIRIEYSPDSIMTENFRSEEQERMNFLISTAKTSLKEKDYVGASVNFSLAAEEFPQSTDSYYLASYAFKMRKDFNEALNYGERLFLREPNLVKNILNLADIHRHIGNYSRSSLLLHRVEDLEPGNEQCQKVREALDKVMTRESSN